MKKRPVYRNSLQKIQRIEELEKNNARFKRVYSEYQAINDEIVHFQSDDNVSLPDDFMEAMHLQSDCLENEIEDWLTKDDPKTES